MPESFRKTYKFATYTSSLITLVMTLLIWGFLYINNALNTWFLVTFPIACFTVSFFIIQRRVERLIYNRIQRIYDDVTILDSTSLSRKQITTDMATLTKQVERFAQDKKLEIEMLNIREAYRKEFIGNVSHELKTPLFTVQGYILTLLDGAMKDKEVRKKYLKRASKGVERLIFIVKDLDMISKLEAGGLDLQSERFNMVKLIRNVFDLLEMKAAKKNITLTFDKPYEKGVYVMGDRDRIQQVLSNLIVNSIKYGKEDGTTEVSIEPLIENKVIIRVTDNGEGIASENIQRIFERFYRVDKSGSRKEGGSGLGLSIVKHIVEAHSEKIYVESQLGVGSEFSFTMEKAE